MTADASRRHQSFYQTAHRVRAQKPRLTHSPGMQQPVGEYVATLTVGAELHLVDSQEVYLPVHRHRLHRADKVARMRWDALLLSRNESDMPLTDARRDAIVDLSSKESQRQADHARLVLQHSFDRTMRLAGIRRTEHCGNALTASIRLEHRPSLALPNGKGELRDR